MSQKKFKTTNKYYPQTMHQSCTCWAFHKLIKVRQALWLINDRLNIQEEGTCVDALRTDLFTHATFCNISAHILHSHEKGDKLNAIAATWKIYLVVLSEYIINFANLNIPSLQPESFNRLSDCIFRMAWIISNIFRAYLLNSENVPVPVCLLLSPTTGEGNRCKKMEDH